ncbi:MAG: RNA pseudouridine synthase [Treponema sp.]|jgi:23S rRNA pseudouridine955/2504/2580 synthase|nr:RNA pseudouridine synthase [Treponema sp.]
MKNISILFENDLCLVLNKPAGLAVQGGERVGASLDKLLAELRSPKPLLVHRLDKDTSGLILVAKTREAAARFASLFAGGHGTRVNKLYLAVCAGCPQPALGSITLELAAHGTLQPAQTHYQTLSTSQDFSLLQLELGTGRMHQIRKHLAHIGHPILGDDKYGDFALNKALRKERKLRRLLLHASRLVIGEEGLALDVTAPPPDYFEQFRESARL